MAEPTDAIPPAPDDDRARFDRIREELAGMQLPDLPDEAVDERRRELSEGVGGSSELPPVPEWTPPDRPRQAESLRSRDADRSSYAGLGAGLGIAYALLGATVAGIAIGYVVDLATGGSAGKPLGALLGIAIGVILMLRIMDRPDNR